MPSGPFDGRWTHKRRPGHRIEVIQGDTIFWHEGCETKIAFRGQDRFAMRLEGEVFFAQRIGNQLLFDDGDAWLLWHGDLPTTSALESVATQTSKDMTLSLTAPPPLPPPTTTTTMIAAPTTVAAAIAKQPVSPRAGQTLNAHKGKCCPDCKKELQWSNYDKMPYKAGWDCNNFHKCGRRAKQEGAWRWHCRDCLNDFCKACHAQLPAPQAPPPLSVQRQDAAKGHRAPTPTPGASRRVLAAA